MFKSARRTRQVSKAEFKALEPQLRLDLVNAQYDLQTADFTVVLLLMGDDTIGVNHLLDDLHEWMDARHIQTRVFDHPTDEELRRPRFWRYWRALPPNGRIGLYMGAWALSAVADRVRKKIGKRGFERRIAHVRKFEQALVDDGALVIKLWLHAPRKVLKKRLKSAKGGLAEHLGKNEWTTFRPYNEVVSVAEQFIESTGTEAAPWHIIDSTDRVSCHVAAAQTLLSSLHTGLADTRPPQPPVPLAPISSPGALSTVDLECRLERDDYKRQLAKRQMQLARLMRRAHAQGISVVLAFEGWDAAGKGGVIRRITASMFAQLYDVISIAAPTDEEKARHYLWRFWRHLPMPGKLLIFDRTWYGRVLVERIEGFAHEPEWQRAYGEINDFEAQLSEHGIVVLKFWLHIDPDEQLRRFEARERTGYKKHKITDEDYRNRERWTDYEAAVDEMVARTHTKGAPWHLIPANDKPYARVQVLEALVKALKAKLD